jgi:hypothetical protein
MHIMAIKSENRAGLRPIPPDLYGLFVRVEACEDVRDEER